MPSRYTTLDGSGFDDIYELERAKMHNNIGDYGNENVINVNEPPKAGSK